MLDKCDVWELLNLFFRCPTKKFHLREISRKLDWGPGKVERKIEPLTKKGLIKEKREKNLRIFIANKDNEKFKNLKKLHNINILENVTMHINEELSYPEAIILYGSAARGEDTEKSDIDLFVIGPEKDLDLEKFEKEIGRELHLMFGENVKEVKKKPELFNNLVNGIVMSGYLKVLK